MGGYTKLDSEILTSTIWGESMGIRLTWITMLALVDKNGEVHGSIPGLARLAGVPEEDCREGITKFLSPDPDSRSKEHDGRRIEEIDGGWFLLNYAKYREKYSREWKRERDAERIQEKRLRAATECDMSQSVANRRVPGVQADRRSQISEEASTPQQLFTMPGASPPNGSLAACLLEEVEAGFPQHQPAVSATPESGAEKTEAPPGVSASAPEPDGTSPARVSSLGLPSREEARAENWPLTERFRHQLGELRGLTACPLSWPKRENRDRFEWLLSRVGVAWAAEAAWSNWREATSRGENVTSLGFFLRLLELRTASPPPEPKPLSDCEPWAQILAKYAENGGRETAKWLKLYVKPSIGDGKLFLAVADEFSGAYVLRHLGEIESEAKKRGLDVELVAPTSPQATSEVSP
jgi:hypothetical protein